MPCSAFLDGNKKSNGIHVFMLYSCVVSQSAVDKLHTGFVAMHMLPFVLRLSDSMCSGHR